MVNLDSLLRFFDFDQDKESVIETPYEPDYAHNDKQQDRIHWKGGTFPHLENTDTSSPTFLSKLESLAGKDIRKMRSEKLVGLLHALDLEMIKNVTVKDLIYYDGTKVPQSVLYIINKNIGMFNWLSKEASFRRLLRLMEHAALRFSFNNLNVLMKAAQSKSLTKRRIKKLAFFKSKLDSQQGGIFPFEWMLKDCAESNLNPDSEIGARRFCIIVEKLKDMKKIILDQELKKKDRLFLYAKFSRYVTFSNDEMESECYDEDMLYVLF